MARDSHLKLDDFLSLWASESGYQATNKSMRRYFNALKNVILKQLELNEEIYLQDIGTFYLRPSGGDIRTMGDMKTKGKTVERFIKPKMVIAFSPSATLERAVNENDFKFVAKKSNKKYTTKVEAREVYNKRRRKPKPTFEELFCDITNEINEKREED